MPSVSACPHGGHRVAGGTGSCRRDRGSAVDAVAGTRVATGPSIAEVSSVGTEHDPPRPDLSGSLSRARALGFVGRRDEVRAFTDALDGSSEALVLFVHGPGGIGKTTLLEAYARHARDSRRSVVYLDAHDVEASAAAVTSLGRAALGQSRGRRVPPSPTCSSSTGTSCSTRSTGGSVRSCSPARPAGSVTVLAGRSRPRTAWTLDPGWHRLLRVLELGELDARESDDLLAALGVEEARRGAMAALAHGSPLALALVAEASADGPVPESLAAAPQVVAELCRLIVDDVPDAAHRSGLATCAHATRMTQDLLARVVGPARSRCGRGWSPGPTCARGRSGCSCTTSSERPSRAS